MDVLKRINDVKAHLAATGGITKDRRAPEAIGGYAFRGIDDADNVLCGLTAEHGLVLVPQVLESKADVRVDAKGRPQCHVLIQLLLTVYAPDGTNVVVKTYGEGIDSGDKAQGKAFSNARKMAVFGLFQIPTHGENVEEYATEVAPAPKQSTGLPQRVSADRPIVNASAYLALQESERAGTASPEELAKVAVSLLAAEKSFDQLRAAVDIFKATKFGNQDIVMSAAREAWSHLKPAKQK